jgi:hypothetical protein
LPSFVRVIRARFAKGMGSQIFMPALRPSECTPEKYGVTLPWAKPMKSPMGHSMLGCAWPSHQARITTLRRLAGLLGPVIQMCRIVPGPSMSQSWTSWPALSVMEGAPLRPTPSLLAALPPCPGAPVGFSKQIDRETRPASSGYGV